MRLRQCLVNLLSNAIKFTPDGGDQSAHRTWLSLGRGRSGILFAVEDTGIDSEDHRERIFEAFYQVDNSATRKYGGAGLGLSLVQSFVEAHHAGWMWKADWYGGGVLLRGANERQKG